MAGDRRRAREIEGGHVDALNDNLWLRYDDGGSEKNVPFDRKLVAARRSRPVALERLRIEPDRSHLTKNPCSRWTSPAGGTHRCTNRKTE